VHGVIETPAGPVPRVYSFLTRDDRLGTIKVRLGIGRMSYTVDPGLYALRDPLPDDPVFVTANYKLSFDKLREALSGRNGWILVLDTKGINVWCAAGKGTFGTEELLLRISACRLGEIVNHRTLILPQLSAPGVAAFEVKRRSGFSALWGPVEADHIPAFLDSGLKATPAMRIKHFPIAERLVLVPVELMGAIKIGIPILFAFFLISFFLSGISLHAAIQSGLNALLALFLGTMAGAVCTPLFLPWLPGKSFAAKGVLPGIAGSLLFFLVCGNSAPALEIYAWLLLIPAISTYWAMNFTGSSTFTSLSGVRKEMARAVPLQVACGIVGIVLWFSSFLAY
jgi:acetyl-CoA decarbonylase/synthase complex subunit gamma